MALPPDPDAIMTREEVAAWLKVRPRQVERLGVPVLSLGVKTKRYLVRDILLWLDGLKKGRKVPGRRSRLSLQRTEVR